MLFDSDRFTPEDGFDLRSALQGATQAEHSEVEELVRRARPGYLVVSDGETTLDGGVYPPDDVTAATVLAGRS